MTINQEYLRSILNYDPETGVFTWRVSRGPATKGRVAGSLNHQGYREIRIDGRLYRAHRLAFFYIEGRWPSMLDHKKKEDGDVWGNLRECANFQNLGNMRTPKHNRSGIKGVFWDTPRKKWHAQIQIEGKSTSLGRFHCIAQAAKAYRAAAEKYFGEFARAA